MKLTRMTLLALVLVGALSLAACGDDDESSSTTSTTTEETTSTTGSNAAAEEERVKVDKEIQAELAKVGCYSGADDGVIGPKTDAAIVAFQQASGLTADGQFGVKTQAALTKASSEDKLVCGATTTTSSAGSTTITTAAGATAPCTATAVGKALTGEQVVSFVCGNGWAAGAVLSGTGQEQIESAYLLKTENGAWIKVTDVTPVCDNPTGEGVPANVLAVSPCKVS